MSRSAVNLFLKFESGLSEGVSPYLILRRPFQTTDEWDQMIANLAQSCTLYIGNLSFYTTEVQITALFSMIAPVKRVIMVRRCSCSSLPLPCASFSPRSTVLLPWSSMLFADSRSSVFASLLDVLRGPPSLRPSPRSRA